MRTVTKQTGKKQEALHFYQEMQQAEPCKRSFFNHKTLVAFTAGSSALALSYKKAPKWVGVLVSISLLAAFLEEKVIPRFIVPSSSEFLLNLIGIKTESDYNVSFQNSEGLTLRGLYDKENIASTVRLGERNIVVFFGGNAMSTKTQHMNLFKRHYPNQDYIYFNYRGTATSDGLSPPTHPELVKDGIAIVQGLKAHGYAEKNIHLIGYSLGGSVATGVARKISVGNLSVMNSFYTLRRIFFTNKVMEIITGLVLKLVGWDYNITAKEWEQISTSKIAIGAGSNDGVIPPRINLASMLTQLSQNTHGVISNRILHHNDLSNSLQVLQQRTRP